MLRFPSSFAAAILAASVLAAPGMVHAAPPVEQWGVFEATLTGPADGNPFTDVTLTATFTHNGVAHEITGFYDGDGTYRVRFMPEQPGAWSYTTHSNRRELNGTKGTFDASPPSTSNHGPVRVAHTFHFAYADGTPYRELGTTSYSWSHRTDEREEETLRTLATAPFNKIRMCVFPQNHPASEQRFFPFEGTPPRAWDLTRPNPAFFRHLEQRVAQLRDLGIEADLILFHPYGQQWGFSDLRTVDDDRYVRYIVARLAAYRNVWWSLANEFDLIRSKKDSDWDRLFQIVETSDPYAHLRSIHNCARIYNNSLPWVTHASIQNGAAVLDPERAVIYRDVWRKPVVFDEVKYEGDSVARWGQLSGEDLVLRFWTGLIAGTYVGHGEIIRGTGPTSGSWLASGGELRGQSPARLAFLRQFMDEMPADGIDPIDKWQDERTAGKGGSFYVIYFGRDAPAAWPFQLYKDGVKDGMTFRAEIVDTWNMTVAAVPGTFVTKQRSRDFFADADQKSVALPGRPYLALRIRRVP